MAGLDEKISRLSPEQLRELEDYVDFLIGRCPDRAPAADAGFFAAPPAPSQTAPAEPQKPVILAEETRVPHRPEPDILPGYKDLGDLSPEAASPEHRDKPVARTRKQEKDASRLLDWID
jgi:hypothetical protein